MRYALLSCFLVASPALAEKLSDGCKKPSTVINENQSVQVGGRARNFILKTPQYVPQKPHALLIEFHGYGMNAGWMQSLAGGVEDFGGDNAIFAYLDAGKASWDGSDDSFFDAVKFQIGQKYCIDLYQVFIAGYSNGAFYANQLAQRRASEIKGLIAVAGGGGGGPGLPAMVVHGRSDQFVPFTSGFETMRAWANSDGCKAPSADNGHNGCEYLWDCKYQVVWCPWGGNHDWPAWLHKDVWEFIEHVVQK